MRRLRRPLCLAALLCALSPAGLSAAPADDARRCIELVNARSDLETAVQHCTRAIRSRVFKGSNLAPLYYNRGWAQDELGEKQQAIADYSSAIKIQSDYIPAYVARGYTHMSLGELDSAIDDYTLVLRVDPDVFLARFNRALALEQRGELPAAMEDYRKAYELRPDNQRARDAMKRLLLLEE